MVNGDGGGLKGRAELEIACLDMIVEMAVAGDCATLGL